MTTIMEYTRLAGLNLPRLKSTSAILVSLVLCCQGGPLACFIPQHCLHQPIHSGDSGISSVPLSFMNFNMSAAAEYYDMLTMHAQALSDNDLPGIAIDDPYAVSDNVRECAICTKEQPLNACPVASSIQHYHDPNACKKCFNRYIVGHIDSGHARIACVECPERLRYKDIQTIVSKTSLRKYDKVLTKAFVEDDVDFHYCVSTPCAFKTSIEEVSCSKFRKKIANHIYL
jgi:hypothetical protein